DKYRNAICKSKKQEKSSMKQIFIHYFMSSKRLQSSFFFNKYKKRSKLNKKGHPKAAFLFY
ncbi:MAG TPA: hypothetical protein DCL77_02940, partial [Prolixibacteraceae bacterium]|nr:hypothetical protein [Prolixibacteraceae bacterium]